MASPTVSPSTSPEASAQLLNALEQRMIALKQEMDKVASKYEQELNRYEQMATTCRGYSDKKVCSDDKNCGWSQGPWSQNRCGPSRKLESDTEFLNSEAVYKLKWIENMATHETPEMIFQYLRQGNRFKDLLEGNGFSASSQG